MKLTRFDSQAEQSFVMAELKKHNLSTGLEVFGLLEMI
jgi:hypothetical protein